MNKCHPPDFDSDLPHRKQSKILQMNVRNATLSHPITCMERIQNETYLEIEIIFIYLKGTRFCLISVGYNLELHDVITFY